MVGGAIFQINGMALCQMERPESTNPTALPDGHGDLTSSDGTDLKPSSNTVSCPQEPCNINIAFVGDSITR